ncbi:propanediol utilization protein [Gammaproteobacteria bacterium]|nr:propanediol utilization protein [Gammaproteobacteria bacterium]
MDIVQKVQDAGVVGAGGAGFPTYIKLKAQAEIYLVNGAECEPLLKVDQQMAARDAHLLLRGLELAMQATKAVEGIIALKAKYKEAIAMITPLLPDNMRIHILKDVYPAGDEVITIWMATGRRVPPAGLPLDVGVIVSNVQTLINVAKAVDTDQNVTQRVLTVTGAVKNPITLSLPIGTSYRDALNLAGGSTLSDGNVAFLNGGPMMGKLMDSLDVPITKTTGGLIALPKDHILIKRRTTDIASIMSMARTVCEQCVLCTEMCPRHLIGHELPPHLIVRSVNYNHLADPSVLLSALTCSECGICEAYACPVEISPMRLNQELKQTLRAKGARYSAPIRDVDPMINSRFVPIPRLISRIDVDAYNVKAPFIEHDFKPAYVTILLSQHIGAPAQAIVKVGDRVSKGQCIGIAKENALSVPVHASISGLISVVDELGIKIDAA